MELGRTAQVAPGAALVDVLVARRSLVAGVLLALAGAAFAGAAYWGHRAYEASPPAAAETDPDTPAAELPPANPDTPRRTEFTLASLTHAMFLVVLGAGGLQTLAGVPKPTQEGRRRDARRLILTVGGLSGLVLMVGGLAFFVYHFGLFVSWLEGGPPKPGMYKPVLALIAFVAGAGLTFLSLQPARADERTDATQRLLIYGGTAVLTGVLLLAALAALNVLVGLKVPNKIDTTATGVNSFTLAPATQEFLASLTTPIRMYSSIPEGLSNPVAADARRMLATMQEANPRHISVVYMSPTGDAEKIRALVAKYPQSDGFADLGVLIVAGEDEKLHASVSLRDMADFTPGDRGGEQFIGESKVLGELLFLAESQTRPVIYFTTGHGELDVTGTAALGDTASRPGSALKSALQELFLDVKPLTFEATNPVVPADATLVVVADPQTPLPAPQVEALRTYMRDPRPDGSKGKLIVLSSPVPQPSGGVVNPGLDELLGDFGIGLGDQYVYSVSNYAGLGFRDGVGVPSAQPARAGLTLDLGPPNQGYVLPNCRPVTASSPGGLNQRAVSILVTPPGVVNWLETDPPADPEAVLEELTQNVELARAKRAGQLVTLAAVAFETTEQSNVPPVGRMIVFGSGEAFVDSGRRGDNPAVRLFTTSVNYLRDKPAANVAAKTYGQYRLSPTMDVTKTLVLPGLIGAVGTIALGVGVYVLRRR